MILSSFFDDELGVDSAARDSDQSKCPDSFTHAMVNVRSCEIPRSVLQADTIVVTCGLANFEQSSWSTHRRDEFCRTHEELHTMECATVVQYGRSTAESSMIPTTTEETHRSKSEDHEVHFGIRELPSAAQSSV